MAIFDLGLGARAVLWEATRMAVISSPIPISDAPVRGVHTPVGSPVGLFCSEPFGNVRNRWL